MSGNKQKQEYMSRAELKQFLKTSTKRQKDKNNSERKTVYTEKKIVNTKKKGRGPQKAPKKVPISLRLDKDVYEFFKASGKGWQTQINALLAEHINSSTVRKTKAKAVRKETAKTRKPRLTAKAELTATKVAKSPKVKAKTETAKVAAAKVQKNKKPRKRKAPVVEQQGSLF